MNQARTQVFCIHQTRKVVVIGKYENFVRTAFSVVLPYWECLNDGPKLNIVSFVPYSSENYYM